MVCVTFQFANLGEKDQECSLEWLVNTDRDISIKPANNGVLFALLRKEIFLDH